MEGSTAPSAEDIQRAQQVSEAAATAIAESDSKDDARERATAAVRAKAHEVKFELSDEDCSKLVDMLIERMDALGAFTPPAAPAAAAAAPASTPEAAAAAAAAKTPAQPPERRSFAERFAGL